MRTPDQVFADLKKAEKEVQDAVAKRDLIMKELSDMAQKINAAVQEFGVQITA